MIRVSPPEGLYLWLELQICRWLNGRSPSQLKYPERCLIFTPKQLALTLPPVLVDLKIALREAGNRFSCIIRDFDPYIDVCDGDLLILGPYGEGEDQKQPEIETYGYRILNFSGGALSLDKIMMAVKRIR